MLGDDEIPSFPAVYTYRLHRRMFCPCPVANMPTQEHLSDSANRKCVVPDKIYAAADDNVSVDQVPREQDFPSPPLKTACMYDSSAFLVDPLTLPL
jgi:hypothetical protein